MTTMLRELAPDVIKRMRPIWAAAEHALRADPMVLADLAAQARDVIQDDAATARRERYLRERARVAERAEARAAFAAMTPEERRLRNNARARERHAARRAAQPSAGATA